MSTATDERGLAARYGPPPVWTAGPRVAAMSGLERILSFRDGTMPLPPAYVLVGMRPLAAERGSITYELASSPWLDGGEGGIDRAALAYFADGPVANAVHSLLPAGTTLRTVVLSMEFFSFDASTPGSIRGEAVAVGLNDDDGVASLELRSRKGRLEATASCRALTIEHAGDADTVPLPAPQSPITATLDAPSGVDLRSMSGVDRLRGMIDGDGAVPPFWELTGIRPTGVALGHATLAMPADAWLTSPAGLLYGGAPAGLATAALDAALWTGDLPTTRTRMLDLTYNFTRMVEPDGTALVAEGRLVHQGRTMVVAEVEVRDSDGRRVGLGRATGRIEVRERGQDEEIES